MPWQKHKTTLGGAETIIDGFQGASGSRRGRPVDAVPGPDGSLYLTDDAAGAAYRYGPSAVAHARARRRAVAVHLGVWALRTTPCTALAQREVRAALPQRSAESDERVLYLCVCVTGLSGGRCEGETMRAGKFVLCLAVVVLVAGFSSGVAAAKKPVVILREGPGGRLIPLHGGISGFFIEDGGAQCSTGFGYEEAELTGNLKSTDKIKLTFTDPCAEATGYTDLLEGRITGIQLSRTGKVTVKGKISRATSCSGKCQEREGAPGGICHYEAKKFIGVVPIPGPMDFLASANGVLNAKISAASCAADEPMLIEFDLFAPFRAPTETVSLWSVYAELGFVQ